MGLITNVVIPSLPDAGRGSEESLFDVRKRSEK
jgi:hypothetical protein